jgi:hypothetical protein
MGRLGHSTVKASLIYQQIVSGRDAEVVEALSGLATDKQGRELAEAAEPHSELADTTV